MACFNRVNDVPYPQSILSTSSRHGYDCTYVYMYSVVVCMLTIQYNA
jgi:hypothetical protein